MTRTALRGRRAHEVLVDHLAHARRDDLDHDLKRNFDPDVVVLTSQGILRGHDGVRLGRAGVDRPSPRVPASIRAIGRYAQIEWRADAPDGPVTGVETFIVRKGRVVVHALRTVGLPHREPDARRARDGSVGGGPSASGEGARA
jgi:hypothetical protein